MIEKIEQPVAEASIYWRAADEGGRSSGPPTALVYMATSVLVRGDDIGVLHSWPGSAGTLSILVQKIVEISERRWHCAIGFLVPDLARPHLHVGSELLILEGPRVVGTGSIDTVFEIDRG